MKQYSASFTRGCAVLLARVEEAEQFQTNHTSGRQQESMTIPKAAHTVL
jgi:hypothetical protein